MIPTPTTPDPMLRGTTSALPAGLAVRAEGLSKCYRIYNHPRDRLLQALWGRDRRGRPKQFYREFWALRALSFELGRGQTLGVVGRNGSGKSTLLQLLCGTLSPTTGAVQLRGRLGALLELGSGFNPEFSGLENVFLNASLLGLSQAETEKRLDRILGFADIGAFIHQPVKTYSSGMTVRLAFAVQAHIDPDVLVVDEALAVGDELFQKKCYAHLERLKDQGTAVLLVTHSCPAIIQHCDRALLLHRGKARMLDRPAKVTATYQRLISATDDEWDAAFATKGDVINSRHNQPTKTISTPATPANSTHTEKQRSQKNHHPNTILDANDCEKPNLAPWHDATLTPQSTEVYPSRGAEIVNAWIETEDGKRANIFPFGEAFAVVFCYKSTEDLTRVALTCNIAGHTGLKITGQTIPESLDPRKNGALASINASSEWQARYIFSGGLWPGIYFIGGGIIGVGDEGNHFIHRVIDFRALRITQNQEITPIGAASLQKTTPHISWSTANQLPKSI